MSPRAIRWTIIAFVLVLWEMLPRTGLVPVLFLPPLTTTLSVAVTEWRSYGAALAVTLSQVMVALVFAVGGGILVGAIVGGIARMRQVLLPVFSSLYAVPLTLLAVAMDREGDLMLGMWSYRRALAHYCFPERPARGA